MKFKYETIVGAEDFNSLFLPQRQAIDKMKYIPPFPMKKLSLAIFLIVFSSTAFSRTKKEYSTVDTSCPCLNIYGNHKIDYYVVDGSLIEGEKVDTVLSKISPKKLEVIKYADANCNCIYLLFVQTKKGMKLKRQIPITLNELENHLHNK